MGSIQKRKRQAGEKEIFHNLSPKQKIRYIWDYYKLPMVVLFIFLYIAAYAVYGQLTKKEITLYTALVNIAAGKELEQDLSSGFLEYQGIDPNKNSAYLYSGLCLTDDETSPDHQYTYASRMKILASIDSEQLDIVLMNREAFDAFSQNGYLCDLSELLASENPSLFSALEPCLVTNTFIAEDNSLDVYFDASEAYRAETEEYPMGLDLSRCPLIKEAGLSGTVYLGVIANSPRKTAAVSYIQYLYK